MALLLPAAMLWLAHQPGLVQKLDAAIYNQALELAAPQPAPDILIVAIDEFSLRELGRWPWPRTLHAQLLERLAPLAPRAVFLDMFLTEPSAAAQEDERLARAMRALPVYLPLLSEPPARLAPGLALPGSASALPEHPGGFLPPLSLFAEQARGVGHADMARDIDGAARKLYLREGPLGQTQPYVGLLLAGQTPPPGDATDSLAANADGWIHAAPYRPLFPSLHGPYRTVSYVNLLRGEVQDELLRGKTVLVGATAPGLGDRVVVPSPSGIAMAGVEVHANAVDSLMHGREVRPLAPFAYGAWVVLPIWLALWLLARTTRHALLVTMGLAVLSLVACTMAMLLGHWWLPPAALILGLLALYLLWSWRRLESQFSYLRRRAQALDALPTGAFELPLALGGRSADPATRPRQALDRAIERIGRLQTLMDEALQAMPVAVLICDESGCIRSSNAAARRLLDEIVRDHPQARAGTPSGIPLPSLLEGLQNNPRATAPDTGGPHWSDRLRQEYRTPGGRVFQLEAEAFGAVESGDRGWIIVLPELTVEREAQRQREEWRRFLSHDLRSPQVTILSLLSAHDPHGDVEPLVRGVRREAERTLALAEGFMDFAQASSDEYRMEDTHLGTVMLDARDQVWPHARACQVQIEARISDADDLMVRGDGMLLTRAVVNLLDNAIRHSAPGGRITLCLAQATDEGTALIAVGDEGDGMREDQLRDHLQGTDARRPEPGTAAYRPSAARGMGLGLAVVREVVRRHGGHIEVASAPGAGASFWLSLPLGDAASFKA
jgi:CHASE2 domain-containing sensor protein/nitrogen-specific signal transduction histidine kinase